MYNSDKKKMTLGINSMRRASNEEMSGKPFYSYWCHRHFISLMADYKQYDFIASLYLPKSLMD